MHQCKNPHIMYTNNIKLPVLLERFDSTTFLMKRNHKNLLVFYTICYFLHLFDKLSLLSITLSLTQLHPHKGWGAATTLWHAPPLAQNFADCPARSLSSSCAHTTHLQETVISTLVAGMLPVIGSKSYTDAMSSSLSITSPSIMSIARARSGSGLIREAHSLAPTERVESPVPPQSRSETRRSLVRPGEAATSQMLKLSEEGGTEGVNARREAEGECL